VGLRATETLGSQALRTYQSRLDKHARRTSAPGSGGSSSNGCGGDAAMDAFWADMLARRSACVGTLLEKDALPRIRAFAPTAATAATAAAVDK